MKLRAMTVNGFAPLTMFPFSVSFEDGLGRIRPVTVLAGPNGCGKTSLLYAIVQALRLVMRYNTPDVPEPDNDDIRRNVAAGPFKLSSTPPSASAKLELSFAESEVLAVAEVFEQIGQPPDVVSRALSVGPLADKVAIEWQYPPGRFEDGTTRPPNSLRRWDPTGALELFKGRSYAISAYRKRLLADRSLLDRIGGICLFPQDRNLRDRVAEHSSRASSVSSGEPGEQGERTEDEGRPRQPRSVWGILQYLSAYVRSRRETLADADNWELRIQRQFDSICRPRRYLGFFYEEDDPNGAPYFQSEEGGHPYDLDKASSGEQVVMEYVTRLNYPSPMNHSLVLIDEPEVHLHPGWIRQVYRALPEIGEGNQYIITTHSQELRTLAAEDNALFDMGELGVPAA